MKHHFRINGEVKEIDCELGSQKLDKNGREIFEGDKVKVGGLPAYVVFRDGAFIVESSKVFPCYLSSVGLPTIEIVND